MKKFVNLLVKWFIIFFLILTLVFAYLSLFHKELILQYMDIIKWYIHYLWYWNYLIILLFWFIESFPLIWVSIPWQMVLIIIAGFLWAEHMYISMLCASIWAILGNYFGYLLGKKYWDSFFDKYGMWIWVTKTDVKYVKKWIDSHGWLFVIIWKFHNLFRAFVPFIAWSSHMHSVKFAISNIVGSTLRAIIMVLLWVFFVENAELVLEHIWKIVLVLLILFAIYIYFFKKEELIKYMYEKNKEMDELFKTKS